MHVIARAVAALPAEVPPDVRAAGEAYLLERAATLNAAALTHLADRRGDERPRLDIEAAADTLSSLRRMRA